VRRKAFVKREAFGGVGSDVWFVKREAFGGVEPDIVEFAPQLMMLDGYARAPVGTSCSVAVLLRDEGNGRTLPLALGEAYAEPGGGVVELGVVTQRTGVATSLLVSRGNGWLVEQVYVGTEPTFLHGGVPADAFAPLVSDLVVRFPLVLAGQRVAVVMRNLSAVEPSVALMLDGRLFAFCRGGRWREVMGPVTWNVTPCAPRVVTLHRTPLGAMVVDERAGEYIVDAARKGPPRFSVKRMRALVRA
jgi:hypothetical protein